jgi:hypothetical protein
MTPEKLQAICEAVDAVMAYSEQKRRELMQAGKYARAQLAMLAESGAAAHQVNHAEILRIGALESEAERVTDVLESWPKSKAAALDNLDRVVGLGVRRTVSPAVQELVQSLAKVRHARSDGTPVHFSLPYIALACGLSEGTVSKLKSGTYPMSSFPATVKVGRRGARR